MNELAGLGSFYIFTSITRWSLAAVLPYLVMLILKTVLLLSLISRIMLPQSLLPFLKGNSILLFEFCFIRTSFYSFIYHKIVIVSSFFGMKCIFVLYFYSFLEYYSSQTVNVADSSPWQQGDICLHKCFYAV